MNELMQLVVVEGLRDALFVFFLIYVFKTTEDREKRYQDLIDTLGEKFGFVEDI